MGQKIGFLTIGQSPRDDILDELIPLLPPGADFLQAGALDGLEGKDLRALAPEPGEFPLISRLKDGSSVIVSRQKVLPLVEAKVKELENRGADMIALLCTEDFPEIISQKPLLLPCGLMKAEAEKRSGLKKITVFVPLKDQIKAAAAKWQFPGRQMQITSLNPYATSNKVAARLEELRSSLYKFKPDLLIFDCLGFPFSLCQKINQLSGLPFLSPRLCLASEISKLLGP